MSGPAPVLDDPLVGDLARLGAGYDEAPAYPADSIVVLSREGLLRRFAPVASGGERFADTTARHLAMFDALRRVGRGDLSVGRLFEGHVNALALFDWYATPDQNAWLADELAKDAMFGVWATEPAPGVALIEDQAGRTLHGAKSFASGANGIAYAIVTVRPANGDRRLAIVAADDPRRTDASGWRVRGMRASMSGLYDLTGYSVDDAALLGAPGDYDREPRFTSGAWRFTAVQLGGIEALLAETRAALSDASRADPLVRAAFGQALVATRTAWLWVREAAVRAARKDCDAATFARMTRGVVERAGLDVMEYSARLIGTRSAFAGQRIDKIIRDLSLYLRQASPDQVRDTAVREWIEKGLLGRGSVVVIAQPLAASPFATARWLVLAPHADDETLGAGALVAETAAEGRLAGIVYLTDGAASHADGGRRLARLRRREAGLAVRRLGVITAPVFLDWSDAHPHQPGSTTWRTTVRTLAALIRSRRVDAIAVTGAEEPHCDHAACHALAHAAIRAAHRSAALFDYRVWSDPELPDARRTVRTAAMPPGQRRHALLAHRSQTSASHGPGFRLARSAWRMPAFDVLHLNGAPYAR